MKTGILIFRVVYSLTLCWMASYASGQAADVEGVLAEIRSAMAERDLTAAKEKLAEADKVRGSESFTAQRERLKLLYDYLEGFWKSVDEAARSLQSLEELMIGDVRVAVVEYRAGLLVLRVKGENRRYTVKTLPAKVALTLAERVLKPDAPPNKVYFGTFLLMDGKGDREIARRLFAEAQKANVNVSSLLPELDVAPVAPGASLLVEIPRLTPIMRKLLAPANWSLRRQAGDRIVQETFKDGAEQTADGYLKISLPRDVGDSQLVYRRKLTGNFGCRVILQNVSDAQVFGLFAADSLDAGYQIALPRGSVMVEFARQGGVFQCRLNQKEVPVENRGNAVPNMVGMIGLTLPAGSNCEVAWFELQAR